MNSRGGITYLASPYTQGGGTVEERVDAACKAAAFLMRLGHVVFCPVAHSHGIADHLDEASRFDHEFWMRQDLEVLRNCNLLVYLTWPGWERSRGMARELSEANALRIPTIPLDPSVLP